MFTEQIWPTYMNIEAKEHWIRKGSSTCQHNDLRFVELAVPHTDRESNKRINSS